jgi:hypothetical protein
MGSVVFSSTRGGNSDDVKTVGWIVDESSEETVRALHHAWVMFNRLLF